MKFEPDKIPEILQKLLSAAGVHSPLWLAHTISWVVLGGVLICAIWGLLFALSKIQELAVALVPAPLNRVTRRRLARRRRFAEHLANEVRRLNSEQSWSDYRFTELEAEVEAEGRRRAPPFLPLLLPRTTSGLRREKSLTKAIDASRERLILIEGDPGSGKSVALRHVATKLADRATRRGLRAVIPFYINMKQIDRQKDQEIDRKLIENFVLLCLNRANDRDVEEFLEDEFDKGLEEGVWLFLFDSFDEIPEILGSTEPDSVVRAYTRAIEDYLYGMNRCRGVVASRYFRGPGQVQWPRFRILPLSPERREELVRRADLPQAQEREILGRLPLVAEWMGDQAKNPLFMSLICEHMKSGRPFPENVHAVFESYIDQRLTRDSDRIKRRYNLEVIIIRKIAEQVAFCMAADQGLGLSPSRDRLPEAMARQSFEIRSVLPTCLDALEFIKLARAESSAVGSEKLFTFAHRRFQEYFATCLVLSSPDRVSSRNLLLDGRWRETAVVICQTANPAALAPLLNEARTFFEGLQPLLVKKGEMGADVIDFPWPSGLLHVLGLLQDGFAGRVDQLPGELRKLAGSWICASTEAGTLSDRKWAVEVCGASEEGALVATLRKAFSGNSRWLAEAAYRQVSRLSNMPPDIEKAVLSEIVFFYLRGNFWRGRHTTLVHLSRLDRAERFLPSYRLLLALPIIDGALHLALLAYVAIQAPAAVWILVIFSDWLLFRPFENQFVNTQPGHWGSTKIWFLSLAMKVNILFVIFAIDNSLMHHHLGISGYWVFGFLAVTFWAPAALYAAAEGKFTRIIWWPVLSFILAIFGFGFILKNFGKSLLKLKSLGLFLLVMVLSPFIGVASFAFLIFLGVKWAIKGMHDMIAWVNSAKLTKDRMLFEDFIRGLESFRLASSRAWFIRIVRGRLLLSPSREMELLVSQLASTVEKSLRGTSSKGWSHEALDELARLREALRIDSIGGAPPLEMIATPAP